MIDFIRDFNDSAALGNWEECDENLPVGFWIEGKKEPYDNRKNSCGNAAYGF